MGCQLGKLAASERRVNNTQADLGDGPPPATDPRLPLTAKQKYSMLASWKGISRAMEKTGICMFIKAILFAYKEIRTELSDRQSDINIEYRNIIIYETRCNSF
ncbi:jg4538 [Pararge aegeria aegeria]|uniref:Jg4538 protein n=1 Tax=Pararge aegeria aegeria TaxID=348720 RepID=A0A8S4RTI7_9NEOP|nr:jg4538 [Pararge aegeria aegeria]